MTAALRYISVCSGIEAASVAWHPLGWTPVAFAEIDRFASAVLAERFGSNLPGEAWPRNGVPNVGDFTAMDLAALEAPVDLLVGGTPCQAFSFAGKRLSLADARGNLTLAYAVLAHELARSHGLRNALWENVPGVLSTPDNAFGCFLGALVGADGPVFPDEESRRTFEREAAAGIADDDRTTIRWPDAGMVAGPRARAAWRVLDAQYFGLAQRRERVFVVADFGNGADPAAVLFEPQGLQGNSPPSREAGQGFAPAVAGSLTASGRGVERPGDSRGQDPVVAVAFGGGNCSGPLDVAATLTAKGCRQDYEVETFLASGPAHTLRAEGFDASEDGTGRGIPLVAFSCKDHGADAADDVAPTLRAMGHKDSHANAGGQLAVAYGTVRPSGWAVRRLTTVECARLQGFPDHHSRIAWRGRLACDCPDGPQYKTYGNSMAVAVMRWLGERIAGAWPHP